jgi:hypothetical protein
MGHTAICLGEFSPLDYKRIINCNSSKGFLWKKSIKVAKFGFIFFEITIFRQLVPAGRQTIAGFLIFFLFSLTHSQIWLIPLVDHRQCGYIIKLRKNNTEWVARTARYPNSFCNF